MLPDRVSNPGPLTYESGALPIALRGPANCIINFCTKLFYKFHKLLQYKCLESNLNLAEDDKVNPRYSFKHFWAKLFTKS